YMQIIEPKNKNFLTPKQLECEFGISLSKQYKMRMQKNQNQANSLPFIKLGKTILYKRSEIEIWLDKNMVKGNL
ncbi:TPA: helix-turn-helix domain-containing protein, partial [Campylobacter jejuni]